MNEVEPSVIVVVEEKSYLFIQDLAYKYRECDAGGFQFLDRMRARNNSRRKFSFRFINRWLIFLIVPHLYYQIIRIQPTIVILLYG